MSSQLQKENNKNKSTTQNEQTSYIKVFCFNISYGVMFTYIYLLTSISLTLLNRMLYHKFNFKFNFTLLFLQQVVNLFFFTFIATKSKSFTSQAGEISFNDFLKLKYYYLIFSFIFTINCLSSFIGNQLVTNTAMFLTLRKLCTIMNYLYDLFINKKTLPSYFPLSVIMLTFGTIFTGYDDLSSDKVGYVVVLINNILSVAYGQITDQFKKKTGVTNLKLLIYNSYISTPFLFMGMILKGEVNGIKLYINDDNKDEMFLIKVCLLIGTSCLFGMILNSSYFISNEKNSSLFTQMVSNCKDIFLSLLSLGVLKDFKLTKTTGLGLLFSSGGAFVFSAKSIKENIMRNKDKKEK